MKKLCFDDYEDLAFHIAEQLNDDCDEFVTTAIAANYEDAIELMSSFIMIGFKPVSIEISDVETNGYDKEYLIEVDNEWNIFVQPAYNEDSERYFDSESDYGYIFGDCNSAIIRTLPKINVWEVEIEAEYLDEINEDEYDCNGDCENCSKNKTSVKLDIDKDDNVKGFTVKGGDKNSTWEKTVRSNDMQFVYDMLSLFF